jgi:hypothetical protein
LEANIIRYQVSGNSYQGSAVVKGNGMDYQQGGKALDSQEIKENGHGRLHTVVVRNPPWPPLSRGELDLKSPFLSRSFSEEI